VRLADLAAYFGVGPRRLNRLFHRMGWASPIRELRRQRLLAVFDQIRTSSRSIEAIAEDAHYSDRSSFARAFQRAFGFYPNHLRDSTSRRR